MDKIKLADLLTNLLPKYKEVSIPGLGSFTIQNVQQYLSPSGGVILPSLTKINFKETILSEYNIVELAKKERLVDNKTEANLQKIIEKSVNQFLNLKKLSITNIGDLVCLPNGRVVIENASNYFAQENEYLPELEVKPLAHIVSVELMEKKKPINSLSKPVKGKAVESSENVKNSKWMEHYLFPILFGLALCALLIYIINQVNGRDSMANSKMTNVDNNKLLPVPVNDSVYQSQIFSDKILERYAGLLTKEHIDNGCIIIVGSFGSSENATEMRGLLNRKNLNIYSETINEVERIGIRFDCSQIDLDEYLIIVRSEISQNAWYLSPDYDVD